MGQNWSTFLDSSRAVAWAPGFTIPTYTAACVTQPSLTAGSTGSIPANNTTSIQNAIASCDATHNVVNIPAGTWYITQLDYQGTNKVVVRGAGPKTTKLLPNSDVVNALWNVSVCMGACNDNVYFYWESAAVQPGGSNACAWTAGYSKGSTTITLNSCASPPPNNSPLILDQINDTADTGGVTICDSGSNGCSQETGDQWGRPSGALSRSEAQSVLVTSVSGSGTGPYTVTISPAVAFNNVRSGQTPGAWWPGFSSLEGLENITIDQSLATDGMGFINCYQCWVKNIAVLDGPRSDIITIQSFQDVIRDSYFFGAQTPGTSQSYGIEVEIGTSSLLIENNIFHQLTAPILFGAGTAASVVGYNFTINNQESGANIQYSYYAHNAANEMNLWEGNMMNGINSDPIHGASTSGTFFRNNLLGWQSGKTQYTYAASLETWARAFNFVGNVLGQPNYQTSGNSGCYEAYATSTTTGVNGNLVNNCIYALGWTGYSGWGGCTTSSTGAACDPAVRSTLMRWGNWDVFNAATQWNSTEASPASVAYVNANFTSSYFSSLAQTLPASLYYNSTPSWWTSGKNWPPIGPDVTTGNVGTCTGTYAGAQATAASQCSGGTLNSPSSSTLSWASHITSIPAQDCYLNKMGGPPDGSGSVLSFDASTCYSASSPVSPSPLLLIAHVVNP